MAGFWEAVAPFDDPDQWDARGEEVDDDPEAFDESNQTLMDRRKNLGK
jgi:hypothetical protein